MKNYLPQINQLPLYEQNAEERSLHQAFLEEDERDRVAYYRIGDNEACAVSCSKCYFSMNIKSVVSINNIDYTVKAIYINHETESIITLPDTVESIYGAEKISKANYPPECVFDLGSDNHPYFVFKNGCWFSKDGEDLIYGCLDKSVDTLPEGIKTIHNLYHTEKVFPSLTIPASVEKICRLVGNYGNLEFMGTLPEFTDGAFDNDKIERIRVFTPKSDSPEKSIDTLLSVPEIIEKSYRRHEDNILFLSHPMTFTVPKAKGYIALTRADFEHDGDTLLVNTNWIATISPRKFNRAEGDVVGSVILIGLIGNDKQTVATYKVYETPDFIDTLIAGVQE